ncbi:MAG: hypothetical protein ABI634_11165 [Acidobacteriota bacterium]
MKLRQMILSVALAVTVGMVVLAAHSITVQGTVVAVEPTRVQVKTTDAKKTEQTEWYAVDRDTLVKRGPKTVKFADARITAGERIVVIVDEHAETKNLAEEIRLAAK